MEIKERSKRIEPGKTGQNVPIYCIADMFAMPHNLKPDYTTHFTEIVFWVDDTTVI